MWKGALNLTGELSSCLVLRRVPSTEEKSPLQEQGPQGTLGLGLPLLAEIKVGRCPSAPSCRGTCYFKSQPWIQQLRPSDASCPSLGLLLYKKALIIILTHRLCEIHQDCGAR